MQPIDELKGIVDDWIKTHGVRYFNELTNMAQLTEEVGEVTINDDPPLNSIPKCNPCVNSVIAEARINKPENEYQIFRLPIKSIEVSPRYKRPPIPESLAIIYPPRLVNYLL